MLAYSTRCLPASSSVGRKTSSIAFLPPLLPSLRPSFVPSFFLLPELFLFSRKLRDEYDKLEGALRKLGVDPEAVVSGAGIGLRSAPVAVADNEEEENDDFGDDEDDYMELGGGTLRRPPRVALEPLTLDYADSAQNFEVNESSSSEQAHHHHHHQQQPNRHRHLDILEEVGKEKRLIPSIRSVRVYELSQRCTSPNAFIILPICRIRCLLTTSAQIYVHVCTLC